MNRFYAMLLLNLIFHNRFVKRLVVYMHLKNSPN